MKPTRSPVPAKRSRNRLFSIDSFLLSLKKLMIASIRHLYSCAAAGEARLKAQPRDGREAEISRLKSKVGGLTMDNELLIERIFRMETARPFVKRRSKA